VLNLRISYDQKCVQENNLLRAQINSYYSLQLIRSYNNYNYMTLCTKNAYKISYILSHILMY